MAARHTRLRGPQSEAARGLISRRAPSGSGLLCPAAQGRKTGHRAAAAHIHVGWLQEQQREWARMAEEEAQNYKERREPRLAPPAMEFCRRRREKKLGNG